MARSAADRLRTIKERERKLQEQMEKSKQELENVLAPTRNKIVKIAEAAASEFMHVNQMNIDEMNIDPKALQEAFADLLKRHVLRTREAAPRVASPTPAVTGA